MKDEDKQTRILDVLEKTKIMISKMYELVELDNPHAIKLMWEWLESSPGIEKRAQIAVANIEHATKIDAIEKEKTIH